MTQRFYQEYSHLFLLYFTKIFCDDLQLQFAYISSANTSNRDCVFFASSYSCCVHCQRILHTTRVHSLCTFYFPWTWKQGKKNSQCNQNSAAEKINCVRNIKNKCIFLKNSCAHHIRYRKKLKYQHNNLCTYIGMPDDHQVTHYTIPVFWETILSYNTNLKITGPDNKLNCYKY